MQELQPSLQHVNSLPVAHERWDLAPCLGNESRPPSLGVWSLNHWTGGVPELATFELRAYTRSNQLWWGCMLWGCHVV